MARPRKTEQDARTAFLNLRLSLAERALIDARASAAGVTATDYARRGALGRKLATLRATQADPTLVLALNRIGVNLNQIAKAMNAGHAPLYGLLDDSLSRLNQLLDGLQG